MSMKLKSLAFCALLALCGMAALPAHADEPSPSSNKDIVLAFFRMMFQDRDIEEAVRRYVGPRYVQHNPYMGDGTEPLVDFFPRYFEQHPQASVEIKRVVAEGDLVVIHNLWKDSPEDRGQAIVDIFRVENGKIAEHWDVSQEIPENPANKNTMF
ncbi:nuclear transport factor 2 family protein [Achromobacter sp. Marseille-Q4962]|uniref:nuclear transport factor 2 family protein n=1 Tax=Achromobacter sp. Marseille-Q4962 TaxID=2942202 RepID=UPI00207316EC|nr:nuclear transport factor 2 family protein [Achromobacter sp. Marseille-Q4962]